MRDRVKSIPLFLSKGMIMDVFNWQEQLQKYNISQHKIETSKYAIICFEYESGWGTKVDDVVYADSMSSAAKFVVAFETFHKSQPTTPGWDYTMQIQPI